MSQRYCRRAVKLRQSESASPPKLDTSPHEHGAHLRSGGTGCLVMTGPEKWRLSSVFVDAADGQPARPSTTARTIRPRRVSLRPRAPPADLLIDALEQVATDGAAELLVVEELGRECLVLLHAADEEALERLVEDDLEALWSR